jgi:manganese/zinc/iron transport system permease protein
MIEFLADYYRHNYNLLLVLLSVSLLGASAGLIGCFAVLRRRALTGDALAHAALPGLCLAFIVVGERSLPAMLLGAFLAGLLGVAIIAALRRWTRIKEDAAIGIVLSVFFGAGAVLSRIIQGISGGSRAGLESYIFGSTAGMTSEDLTWITSLALLTLFAVLVLFKEFQLIAFDPAFAQAQGWPVYRLDLVLMGLIALAVVIGLPAVGVLLIAALLIIPAAAARFWTNRLSRMLLFAALFGVLAGTGGTLLSATLPRLPTGATINLVAIGIFLASALAAPRRGLVARAVSAWRFRRELARQAVRQAA